jgi:hypothetical protein
MRTAAIKGPEEAFWPKKRSRKRPALTLPGKAARSQARRPGIPSVRRGDKWQVAGRWQGPVSGGGAQRQRRKAGVVYRELERDFASF